MQASGNQDADDGRFMAMALDLARRAEASGEVPIGCVVVRDGRVIGQGWNQPIGHADPTAHAEIVALRAAAREEGNYRLPGCTLYVTLEPCPMCAGAMVHARVARLVYAAADPRAGAAGSAFNLLQAPTLNHRVEVTGGVGEAQSRAMLQEFFRNRR